MKKTHSQKSRFSLLLSLVLLAAMVLSLAACSTAPSATEESPSPQVSDTPSDVPKELGEGETQFALEVVFQDGKTTNYTISTDEKTVGAALLALELIAGDQSEFGLFVKTVDGVTADYDADGTYWAFYIDGEYAAAGIDATEITAGSVYSLKVEK